MISAEIFGEWEKKLPRRRLIDRDSFIIRHSAGKSVVHLGACDSPMTRDKAAQGTLLHQKLSKRSRSLIGFDIDESAIEFLKRKHAITDIQLRDFSSPRLDITDTAEVVICGDIIEHVNNVGNLLTNCNRVLRDEGILVLSTINAPSIKQALRAALGREPVHPDHVSYYSYATLGVLLDRFGFRLEECRYFSYPTVTQLAGIIFRVFYRLCPQSADGIIVQARKARAA